jgi:flagellar biosynthesis/type III secretory pathway protein FliH
MNKNMTQLMDNSLKLSYDMLFENNSLWEEAGPDSDEESQTVSLEEMEKQLQERDTQWQKRLEQECSRAEEAGFKKGFAEGKDEAEHQCMKRITGFEEILRQMDLAYDQALEGLKPHVAGLVFDMTEKVLDIPFKHKKLRERVREEVAQLIEKLDEELHIKVMLSEADFDMVQEAFEHDEEMNHITLYIDEELNQGEYKVETKKECIIKNFKKMVADFKESVSFTDIESLQPES